MTPAHYILAMAVWNSALAIAWSKSNWFNIGLKLVFTGAAIWGWYIVFHS